MLHTRNVDIHERTFNIHTLHATHTHSHTLFHTSQTRDHMNLTQQKYRSSRQKGKNWRKHPERISIREQCLNLFRHNILSRARARSGGRGEEKERKKITHFDCSTWNERAYNITHSHIEHINGNVPLIYRFCAGNLRQSFERENNNINNSDGIRSSSSSKQNEKIVEMN